jgi:hypothetical protein
MTEITVIEDIVSAASLPPLDNDNILRAASKVSSAHINSFLQNGVIVIRKVFVGQPENAMQLARAVACRLLGAPACTLAPFDSSAGKGAWIYFSDFDETILGFGVGPGDILVASSEVAKTSYISWKEGLMPCEANNCSAVIKDRLFGTRGETPTTVIQWSKGTIF